MKGGNNLKYLFELKSMKIYDKCLKSGFNKKNLGKKSI